MAEKIKSFTDLNAWKEGHKLVLLVYQITANFPSQERFALIDQMRRAVVSVTSNVAEGFSRQSYAEKVQLYCMAQGSLTELQNQLLVAKDVGYLKKEDFQKLANQSVVVHKLISGLIKSTRIIRDH
jgi:four helix bundle protein